MIEDSEVSFPFFEKRFRYNDNIYHVTMTPELFKSLDDEPMEGYEHLWIAENYKGLDFTGAYIFIVNGTRLGTQTFRLEPEGERWVADRPGADPGLIDYLNDFITEVRKNDDPA